ncbi:MAG: glycine zipper domain-containing protein [Gemmatimonadota bacterium]
MKTVSALFSLALLLPACGGSAPESSPAETAAVPQETAAAPEAAAVVSAEELGAVPPEAPAAQRPARPAAAKPAPVSNPTPAEEPAREPEPPTLPAPLALSTGTDLAVTTRVEITSRTNKAGETLIATVAADVDDAEGRTVVPAGAVVTFRILEIKPAENKGGQGTLVLQPVSVRIDGESYPVKAEVTSLQSELKGRGVTAGDAAKVGAGAAAGALIGRILGKKASGTVVGGVVGGAVGTAVAIQTADQDIVVPAGSRIGLRLTGEFSRSAP